MRARLASLVFLAAATCAASRPSFIKGSATTWTIPLVGPLENAELVIPVTIEDQGPFLMVIDPGAPSAIDREIGDRLGIEIVNLRGRSVNQEDQVVGYRVYRAEGFGPPGMQYYRGLFMGLPRGSYRLANMPVDGLFGDLGSTLIVDVDRDAGVVRIAYTGHEQAPAGGVRLPMDVNYGLPTVDSVIHHAGKQVNARLVVDLRQPYSRVWAKVAEQAGLAFAADRQVQIGDEYGTWVGVPAPQEAADVVFSRQLPAEPIAFAEYNDKRRYEDVPFEGVLGQDVLSRHRVLFDQDHEALWLAPRDADLGERAAARISRWPELARCAATGCAVAGIAPPQGELGSPKLIVSRAPDAPGSALEIVIQALDAAGKPLPVPLLRASLAAGQDEVSATYLAKSLYATAAAFRVVDASPFPPSCTGESCIVAVGR
jgi:hypothetical protein